MRRTRLLALPLAVLLAGPLALLGCDAADPAASGGLTADVPLASAAAKSDVCHYDADAGTYHLITIADAALPAHIEHGDASPGEPVPQEGYEGYVFDEACQPVSEPLAACFTTIYEPPVDVLIDPVTGAITGTEPCIVEPEFGGGSCVITGSVTQPTGAIASVGEITGFTTTQTNVDANQSGGGCDVGSVDSFVDTFTLSSGSNFDGTFVGYCDGVALYSGPVSGSLVAGACPASVGTLSLGEQSRIPTDPSDQ